jgi:hypothetical protein
MALLVLGRICVVQWLSFRAALENDRFRGWIIWSEIFT